MEIRGGQGVPGPGVVGPALDHLLEVVPRLRRLTEPDLDQAEVVARVDEPRGAVECPREGGRGILVASAALHRLDPGVVGTTGLGDAPYHLQLVRHDLDRHRHPLHGIDRGVETVVTCDAFRA